jgi:hypothetical protein
MTGKCQDMCELFAHTNQAPINLSFILALWRFSSWNSSYPPGKDLDKCCQLFGSTGEPSFVSIHSLIKGYAKQPYHDAPTSVLPQGGGYHQAQEHQSRRCRDHM